VIHTGVREATGLRRRLETVETIRMIYVSTADVKPPDFRW